jgi:tetratricopeptide (TPR) repeat protein
MPVLRKREEVRSRPQMGPIQTSPSGFEGALAQEAEMLAQKARMYGQAMGEAAEDEAIALTRGAIMTMDENGAPQMPPNPTARMGRIAQRTYNRGIAQQYLGMYQNAAEGELNQAFANNPDDIEAYTIEANERLARLRQGLDPAFAGAAQALENDAIVRQNAQIGWAQARQNDAAVAGDIPQTHARVVARIREAILLEDIEGAQEQLRTWEEQLSNLPERILPTAERNRLLTEARGQTGLALMMKELGIDENTSVSELTRLAQRLTLADPEDPAMGYFAFPGETTADPRLLQAATNYLNTLLAGANDREQGAQREAEIQRMVGDLDAGRGQQNDRYAAVQDITMARTLGIPPSEMTAERWLDLSDRQRIALVGRIKDSGTIPQSLLDLSRQFENGTLSDDELLRFHRVWRDLRDMPSANGTVVDRTGFLPDRINSIMQRAESLSGGSAPGAQPSIQAIRQSIADHLDPPTPERMVAMARDLVENARVRSSYLGAALPLVGRRRADSVTPENAEQTSRSVVIPFVFSDVPDATDAEKDQAMNIFTAYYMNGTNSVSQALSYTRQQMSGRFGTSRYMAGRHSSLVRIETLYPTPSDSLGETLLRTGAGISVAPRRFMESVITSVVGALPFGYQINDNVLGRGMLGSDQLQVFATPVDAIIDAEIRHLISEMHPLDGISDYLPRALEQGEMDRLLSGNMTPEETAAMIGDRLPPAMVAEIARGGAISNQALQLLQRQRVFMPGRDYMLRRTEGGGAHPNFSVVLQHGNRAGEVIGTINLGPRWEAFERQYGEMERFLAIPASELPADERAQVLRYIEQGRDFEAHRLMRQVLDQRTQP